MTSSDSTKIQFNTDDMSIISINFYYTLVDHERGVKSYIKFSKYSKEITGKLRLTFDHLLYHTKQYFNNCVRSCLFCEER